MKIDPGIDTSLDPRAGPPPTPPAPATPATPATSAETPVAAVGGEEEFYPPDHHMHSSHRKTAQEATAAPVEPVEPGTTNGQRELDLTTPPAAPEQKP